MDQEKNSADEFIGTTGAEAVAILRAHHSDWGQHARADSGQG